MIPDKTFAAPIPGESLTHPPGSFPWERPPQYTDPHEAADHIWRQITQPAKVAQILYFLEEGITVVELASLIVKVGFTEGLYTVHTCVIILQPVVYMIEAMAMRAKIKYKLKPEQPNPLLDAMVEKKLQEEPVAPQETTKEGEKVAKELPKSSSGFFKKQGA